MTTKWLEKELEDYIVANPQELCAALKYYFEGYVSVLGRQVRCRYGIIDVLLWLHNDSESTVLVVECKAKHEKGLAVEQLQRYQAAIADADIYKGLPNDAWPEFGTDYGGWAHHIDMIQSAPVIVAPSFSDTLVTTFNGFLVAAQKIGDRFTFEGLGGPYLSDNGQLNDVLAPVIERAQIDGKARHIEQALPKVIPNTYQFNIN